MVLNFPILRFFLKKSLNFEFLFQTVYLNFIFPPLKTGNYSLPFPYQTSRNTRK